MIKIQNIVATSCLKKPVSFQRLQNSNNFDRLEYEPETYPAILIKLTFKGKLRHCTVYRNGKLILTGFQSFEDISAFDKIIKRKLKEYLSNE